MDTSDFRSVFRVLSDARELRYDQPQQERVIVDAMTDLLGACFGHAMQVDNFRPGAPTCIKRFVPGSIQDRGVTKYLTEWGRNSDFDDDPMSHITRDKRGPAYTISRSAVMSYQDMVPYRIFEEMVEPAGGSDVILTFFRYPQSNTVRQYAFQRKATQKDFEPRQLALADLFISELHKLYQQGVLEPSNLLIDLPRRLLQVAHQLRTGRSQPQIALHLNLSYQTVRSYTKELYDIVGVISRAALVAKLFNGNGVSSGN